MGKHYASRNTFPLCFFLLSLALTSHAQVDTAYIYNSSTAFGTLDIRIARSSSRYYYLQPDKTFSYRESSPGVKTNTFRDMTSWNSNSYTQGNLREKNGSSDKFILNYRLLFPSGYNGNYSPGYPMIVMLHGAGERGNCWDNDCYHDDRSWNPNSNNPPAPTTSSSQLLNNDHNLLHGGKEHLDARNRAGSRLPNDPSMPSNAFPGFVLFPQNLNGWNTGTVQDAIRLVRLVAKQYNIDEDRIYVHGLSNGGIAVYEAIKRAPWLFAAALTMSSPTDANVISQDQVPNVAHIPMWTFQGGKDTAPSPGRTAGYVRDFRKAGTEIRYSFYENLAHGTWNTAYKEPDFFSWILDKNKANIHLFGGSSAICLTNGQGVRMELAKGFFAYQWERNGALISGATSSSYVANTTGTYRARFSRVPDPSSSDWNEWSEPITVTEFSPQQAEIGQTGTVVLRDLNNFNSVKLHSEKEADHYYWYKDGEAVNLYGYIDDTVRYATIASNIGNGEYTLVTTTADFCPSPPSDPEYVFFSNSAPTNITAPTNFAGNASSSTTIQLSWTDASSGETGFEVWRRKVTGTSTYTPWEMRVLTSAGVKSFTDNGAEPSSTYHYKIRAVSNTGRSNYTPAASNAYLVVSTTGDNVKPSTPQNLTAAQTGINTIKLSWSASSDNTGIRQYVVLFGEESVSTNGTETTYTLRDLTLNTSYSFTVKAEDLDGNLSDASNTAASHTYVEGLYYEHSTGAWQSIDEIDWDAEPEYTGHVPTVTLNPRTQQDYFNFRFEGYLYIEQGGTYQFRTNSSDGSRVEIDGVVVVNNDGVHGSRTVTGQKLTLAAGPRHIVIKYFEFMDSQKLTVDYKGPDSGGSWLFIPASALRSGTPPSGTTMASGNSPAQIVNERTVEPLAATIYPNPARQHDLNLQIGSAAENIPVQVRILDFTGREVYRKEFFPDDLMYGLKIEPDETLLDGIYVLMVSQGNQSVMQRISIRN